MGIIALIRAALEAFLEISSDFKLALGAYQKSQAAEFLATKVKALQDTQNAMTADEYKAAAKEIHESLSQL